jgi:hypothetical protein
MVLRFGGTIGRRKVAIFFLAAATQGLYNQTTPSKCSLIHTPLFGIGKKVGNV